MGASIGALDLIRARVPVTHYHFSLDSISSRIASGVATRLQTPSLDALRTVTAAILRLEPSSSSRVVIVACVASRAAAKHGGTMRYVDGIIARRYWVHS
jgi:hypothetical protein